VDRAQHSAQHGGYVWNFGSVYGNAAVGRWLLQLAATGSLFARRAVAAFSALPPQANS